LRILVTGGGGFVGSHVVEHYARHGDDVIAFDNLSRSKMLGKSVGEEDYNWNYIKKNYPRVKLIREDVAHYDELKKASKGVDAIVHAAAQVAVTSSVKNPRLDFEVNALGTFNILESARANDCAVVYCSTNKVYGENVNRIGVKEKETRYVFERKFRKGVPESFPIDLCEHTPYGCSKLAGDIYTQEYGRLYGLKTAVFRLSCIYGTRQFGVEDQGWVAWFTIATVTGKPITIYGDGKQVRDVLYVRDLVDAFDAFLKRSKTLTGQVFNIGGGPKNTLSLIELMGLLEKLTGKRSKIRYSDWRPSDQKVYVSDISKAEEKLKWSPKISPLDGLQKLVNWVSENRSLFR